jgi:TetR/AcrR family transcriptional regulator, tetracycline repressor protein
VSEPYLSDLPDPPWLRARRPRPTRERLTREAIVDGALRVLDCEGAAKLSMRRIAQELGCGVGAIYWHVENKEQLIQLVFDRVIGEFPLPEVDPKRWREQVKDAARAERDVMRRHPGIAELSFGRIPFGPNAIRYFEWHLSLLRAGLSDDVAALAGDLIHLYVSAYAYEECVGVRVPAGDNGNPEEFIGEMREYMASLPPERFPNLTALAAPVTAGGPEERFEFGLDTLLDGLVARSRT